MRKIKRITSIILAALMVMSLFAAVPMTVNAAPPGGGGGGGTGTGITITPVISADLPESKYLTFTAEEAGSSVTLNVYTGSNLLYNKNNSGWQSYTAGTQIALSNVGDYVRFRGKDTTFDDYNYVSIDGKVAASGNVMSLRLDDDGESQGLSENCFYYMFMDCAGLTAAPELPETILAENCYCGMFSGCTSLTVAPELPATTLAYGCYDSMFAGCGLTTAPELWSTSLARYCYSYMFYGCESLTTAPVLPATSLEYGCYSDMFQGCTSLTTAPVLPATELEPYCYDYMFSGCESLTTAPVLPATTLADHCYQYMFEGCTSLTTAPELPATELEYNCYDSMFYGCSSIKLSETQTAEYSIPYRVPSGGNGTAASYYDLYMMFEETGGTFTGTPEINKTYYLPAPAPAGNTLKASDLSTGDSITNDITGFDPEDYTFTLKANRYCSGIGYEPDVKGNDRTFTAADDNFTLKVIDGTLVAYYDWGDPDTYRFADSNGDVTNTAYVLAADHTNKEITLGGYPDDPAPTYDYTTDGNDGYNFNDTLAVGAGDTLAAANGYSNLFNLKILGVQKKADVDVLSSDSKKDVRFVSVVNTDILKDADEYGYVFAKFDSKEDARAHCDEIQAGGSKVLTKPCTATDNTISGDYGIYNEDTAYKYVTATVNGIGDDTVAARFYVRKGSTYYYADYTNDQNQTYGVCAAAYSDLA